MNAILKVFVIFVVLVGFIKSVWVFKLRRRTLLHEIFSQPTFYDDWARYRREKRRHENRNIEHEEQLRIRRARTLDVDSYRDPKNSPFWDYILNPKYRDPRNRHGKLLRRRFRVPYPLFQSILQRLTLLLDLHCH